MRPTLRAATVALLVCLFSFLRVTAQQETVNAVLFYSPTCPHCQEVIQVDLPPLLEAYGDQLQILAVDVTQPGGQALYQAAIVDFAIPAERFGVPTLIVGEAVLVGSAEIPEQFPGLIEAGLAGGGRGWPAITGLQETLAGMQPPDSGAAPSAIPTSVPPTSTPAPGLPTVLSAVRADPVALLLAGLVLVALVLVIPIAWLTYRRTHRSPTPLGRLPYLFPLLAIAGALVAAYLLSVEATGSQAFCGPIGDCNAVQQSSYARLFGILPIAALGLLLQFGLLVAWLVVTFVRGSAARAAAVLLLTLSALALLFSIYLTCLELFVIGAVCAWCLTSAAIVAVECWLAAHVAGRCLAPLPGLPPDPAPER